MGGRFHGWVSFSKQVRRLLFGIIDQEFVEKSHGLRAFLLHGEVRRATARLWILPGSNLCLYLRANLVERDRWRLEMCLMRQFTHARGVVVVDFVVHDVIVNVRFVAEHVGVLLRGMEMRWIIVVIVAHHQQTLGFQFVGSFVQHFLAPFLPSLFRLMLFGFGVAGEFFLHLAPEQSKALMRQFAGLVQTRCRLRRTVRVDRCGVVVAAAAAGVRRKTRARLLRLVTSFNTAQRLLRAGVHRIGESRVENGLVRCRFVGEADPIERLVRSCQAIQCRTEEAGWCVLGRCRWDGLRILRIGMLIVVVVERIVVGVVIRTHAGITWTLNLSTGQFVIEGVVLDREFVLRW